MPEPEIARRCYHCGASIRERAFFCPQCGKELDWHTSDSSNLADSPDSSLQETNPWLQETIAPTPANHSSQEVKSSLQETIGEISADDSSQEVRSSLQETMAESSVNYPAQERPSSLQRTIAETRPEHSAQELQPSLHETMAEAPTRRLDESSSGSKQTLSEKGVGSTNKKRRRKDRERGRQEREPAPTTELSTAATTSAAPSEQKRDRSASIARESIEDNVLHRVQQLRRVSTVVFDQAAYDPSLRFILVAAVLFFLFLLIVVLSKLIG